MRSKLGPRESMALLLAALASAAALAAVGFSLGPNTFSPWAMALGAFLVAGLAGAVTAWVSTGRPYVLPLGLLLLPLCRAALAAARHGLPPWWFSPVDWLLGDEFPLWAGAMSAAAAYAGALARCYIREVKYGEAFLARAPNSSAAEAGIAREEGSTVSRLVMFPFLIGTVLAGLLGVGQGLAVRFYAAVFLLAGLCLAGQANARHRQTIWQARGVETRVDLESDWWRGHAVILWVLLAFLPLLPGGFRPIDPRGLISRLLGTVPPPVPPRAVPRLQVSKTPPESLHMSGWFGKIVAFVYQIAALICTSLVICLAFLTVFYLLRGIWFRFKGWLESFGPLWEGIKRFCASLLALLRGALDRGKEALYRAMPGLAERARRRGNPASRRHWPASRTRMLFARLVIWGREEGLGLPSTFAPAEIAARLAEHVPERREDLAYLVELYRHERYGELKPERKERRLYREAWERVMRSGSGKEPHNQF